MQFNYIKWLRRDMYVMVKVVNIEWVNYSLSVSSKPNQHVRQEAQDYRIISRHFLNDSVNCLLYTRLLLDVLY